jgi:ketosteroid isomerase-like protein
MRPRLGRASRHSHAHKKWHCLVTVFAGFILSTAAAANFENEIAAEGGKWARYYEQGDLDGLTTLYVDDAIVALHGQPALFGVEAIRKYFSTRIGKAESIFELEYELRETHGEIAYIISKYWLKAVDKQSGATYRDAGRSLLVYKKHNGQWKIAADIDQATPDVSWPAPSGLE